MSDQSFERAVGTWLESGSDRTPTAAIDAVLLAVKTTPQERDLLIPRRFITMPTFMRLAAAIAIVAVVGAGALIYANREPGVGGQPTPTAVPTVTDSAALSSTGPPIGTSTWIAFHSDRYGFTISHPVGWTEHPADHDWTVEGDADQWLSTGQDAFIGSDVRVSAWSVAVEPGTFAEEWIQAYCPMVSEPCTGIQDRGTPVFIEPRDQHPGLLVPFADDTQAFILDGDRMHVVAVWWGESEPAVRPFGGSRRLLEAFLSTMVLGAPEATSKPS
jgi:hypothetical protein